MHNLVAITKLLLQQPEVVGGGSKGVMAVGDALLSRYGAGLLLPRVPGTHE